MKIVKTINEVREIISEWKSKGYKIGLVPTMGYLHEGHLSLISRSLENDKTVVSIFVNPIQFGPNEDFEDYPRNLESDADKCRKSGADLIFAPDVSEMYENNFSTFVDMTGPTDELCGIRRPGHFRGVCTVVSKLFNIVAPDRAYFGQKDAQQLAVIKRMVRDLSFGIEIIGCPIVREEDGLAKSSRNTYHAGRSMIMNGETDVSEIISFIKSQIETEPLAKIDYVKAVDADSIAPVNEIKGNVLIAAAVYFGKTRLIDNFIAERN